MHSRKKVPHRHILYYRAEMWDFFDFVLLKHMKMWYNQEEANAVELCSSQNINIEVMRRVKML